MRTIALLGSTGSIGTQTLEVLRNNKDIKVSALTASSNIDLLEKQIREFSPNVVCVYQKEKAEELKVRIADLPVKVTTGMEGLIACATEENAEMVVTAVVGMIGLIPTIEAIKRKKDIALANKETLVTAGHIIMPLVKEYGVKLLPVDSEHSAIFQSLQGCNNQREIHKLILTASGGPFRDKKREDLKNIQVEDALKHPNWSMGRKITIDSATMVNKGLEVMEAKWLFDVTLDQIEVVIQPQSIIHSGVEFVDGGIIAELGTPDMKLPIQYALYYPERRFLPGKRLDFFELAKITFQKPDLDNFPGLRLAYEAMSVGGSMPTVYNAANECAVAKFLNHEISFLDITDFIQKAMSAHKVIKNPSVSEILFVEKETYDLIEKGI